MLAYMVYLIYDVVVEKQDHPFFSEKNIGLYG